jgi:hypothetical protein
MRYSILVLVLSSLLQPVRAQEDPMSILDRAIKAHGGAEKLARLKAIETRAKGRLEVQGGLDFTETTLAQLPAQVKESIRATGGGQQRSVTLVFNVKEGWVRANDRTVDMEAKMVESMQNACYIRQLSLLYPLKEQTYRLTALPPMLVVSRPAFGFRVASKGHKDVSLYFDQESGLLVRMVFRTLDFTGMNEVTEERSILAYQDVDGLKATKRLVSYRDGNKFMEAEILATKLLDKIEDREFDKP